MLYKNIKRRRLGCRFLATQHNTQYAGFVGLAIASPTYKTVFCMKKSRVSLPVLCIIFSFYTHQGTIMRTNIVINDSLINEAILLTGIKTKKEVVELGLKTLIRLKNQEKIRAYKGKLAWNGNLEAMREDE
jgi:Arc/MetJ family transcription regulator